MRFRLATANLMAPAGPFLKWGQRPDRLGRLLATQGLQLIATQEATAESIAILRRHFPHHQVFGRGRRADGSGIQSALFFQEDLFRFRAGGHFWLSDTPEQAGSKFLGMGSPRVATWARLETGSLGSSEFSGEESQVLRTNASDHWPVIAQLQLSY